MDFRKSIDGTYHRVQEDKGYLWYAEPQEDELNQPVREVPRASAPIPLEAL